MIYQDLGQFVFSRNFQVHVRNFHIKTMIVYQDKIEEMEKRLAQAGKDKSEVVPWQKSVVEICGDQWLCKSMS